jgi:hypothetical protein
MILAYVSHSYNTTSRSTSAGGFFFATLAANNESDLPQVASESQAVNLASSPLTAASPHAIL